MLDLNMRGGRGVGPPLPRVLVVEGKRGWVVPVSDGRRRLGGELSFSALLMYLIRAGFGGFGIGSLDVTSEL